VQQYNFVLCLHFFGAPVQIRTAIYVTAICRAENMVYHIHNLNARLKCLAFHGTPEFITAFTAILHLSLFLTKKILRIYGFHRISVSSCLTLLRSRYFFYPEDGGDTFFRNVGFYKTRTAAHPRRRHSSR
jgi:hypothetical protein